MEEKDAGLGPLGLMGGRGGIAEGMDLEWTLTSTGEPGIAGFFFSPLSVRKQSESSG